MGFVAAGQRVELVGRHTWLEAIHTGNTSGRRIMPNSFFNDVFLGKDKRGRFKPVPEEIRNNPTFYTGTVGVVGAKGKPLGATVESECKFAGSMKTVVVTPDKKQAALVDTILSCDHGFAPDGMPLLPLLNARTEKPIRTDEEMGEADTVLLKLKGQKRRFKIQTRAAGVLEVVGDVSVQVWVSDSAAISFLRRDYDCFYPRHFVYLYNRPSYNLFVAMEASERKG